MKFQVGSLAYFQKDDPEFDTFQAALEKARQIECDYSETSAIWAGQEYGSGILAIVFDNTVLLSGDGLSHLLDSV